MHNIYQVQPTRSQILGLFESILTTLMGLNAQDLTTLGLTPMMVLTPLGLEGLI